jgi:hypothetical protein
MNHFYKEIEAALKLTVTQYAPEGTESKALVHQWMHALAYGFTSHKANTQIHHRLAASKSKYLYL